jgi:hypothetical protein
MYAPLRAVIGWRVQLVEQYWKGEAHARFPLTAERQLRYCWLNPDQIPPSISPNKSNK